MTNQEEIRAVIKSIELGRILNQTHPEIRNLYLNGRSLTEIVNELEIQERYIVTRNIAIKSVWNALVGYDKNYLGRRNYEGLLTEEERIRIGKEHNRENGRTTGLRSYQTGTGIFRLTHQQRRELGHRTFESGLGIFGRTPERHKSDSRKAGRSASIKRGQIPWEEDELLAAYELSQQQDYIRENQPNKGYPNYKKIAQRLADIGYPLRSTVAVRGKMTFYRKSPKI